VLVAQNPRDNRADQLRLPIGDDGLDLHLGFKAFLLRLLALLKRLDGGLDLTIGHVPVGDRVDACRTGDWIQAIK